MTIPKLSKEKRLTALAHARDVRAQRGVLKQQLSDGTKKFSDVLAHAKDDEVISNMPVIDLISTQKSFGEVRSLRLMDEFGIAHNRRIRGLGKHQTEKLIAKFG